MTLDAAIAIVEARLLGGRLETDLAQAINRLLEEVSQEWAEETTPRSLRVAAAR